MKIAELTYHSDVILHKPARDSSNVRRKLAAIKMEIKDLKKLDSIAGQLGKRNFDEVEKDYHHFITKVFGSTTVLKSTISTTQEYAAREQLKREKEWEATSQLLKWIVVAPDSIPLFTETNRDLKYKPLVIQEEKFTFGLAYPDSLHAAGYFYTITPSRQPELKVNFSVDKANFKKSNFRLFKGLSTSDGSGNAAVADNSKEPFNYDFVIKDLAGKKIDFREFQGKVVFLNLWATWCGPCRTEMPAIQQLYDGVDKEKIAFVMLSLDKDGYANRVAAFVKSKDFSFPVYMPSGYLAEQLQVPSIPTTFVIAKDGTIAMKEIGMKNYNTPKFKKYLNGLVAR